jgi:hypothetical protein
MIRRASSRLAAVGGRGDDLALKAAFDQQWNASAMIEVGVRQQQKVDARRIKAEVIGVLFLEFPAALVKAAVNQDAFAGALQQVAGAGHTLCGTVK